MPETPIASPGREFDFDHHPGLDPIDAATIFSRDRGEGRIAAALLLSSPPAFGMKPVPTPARGGAMGKSAVKPRGVQCLGGGLRTTFAVVVATMLSAALIEPSEAQTLRDDFTGAGFSTEIWYPCFRDENALSIVRIPEGGFNAAMLLVNPRRDIDPIGLRPLHSGCRQQVGTYYRRDNKEERAELWEADGKHLKFGTEVWYRFSMYIDPAIPRSDGNRLVIGEWKEDGAHSPMVAQRFMNRHFTITIEQDNDAAARMKGDDDCRILVAHDEGLPSSRLTDLVDATELRLADSPLQDGLLIASDGHARIGVPHGGATGLRPCATGIKIRSFRNLPDVFGRWTLMMYHLRASVDGDGLLEVWANGKPIVSVTGRIGFRDHRNGRQYFKFGPYRDHVAYSTYAMLAKFARGPTRAEVDP
jgi:polysaccharide lyase-like protein